MSIIIAEPEVCDRLHPAWKAHFDGRLQIVRSHRLFVEGNPLDVSKGRALAFVAGCLGVPREATIAVGDNDNDRTMIEWAGLGVAMGNAPAELQAVADYVAPPVDEDGAAEVLERFVLHE
jgi:hydroxymethylpyrimidine pyrophosphatase-like HAD family hydrolase